jgi:hypothetical protein
MDNEKVPAAMQDNVTQVDARGMFKGSDEQLCNSIDALLDLNRKGAVSHRVPGMAVSLLEAAAERLEAQPEVKALVEALEKAVAFYDNLSRPHDTGEAQVLDEMAAALAAYHEAQP